jgi:O-antigen/teichoic acid export membrane protein
MSVSIASALVAIGWQVPRVGVQTLSALLNVLLNFFFVHIWGVVGVAIIYVFTEAVLCIGYYGLFLIWKLKQRKKLKTI